MAAATLRGGAAHAAPAAKRARPAQVKVVDLAQFQETFREVRSRPGTRGVFINVWATWCEPCRDEMPDIVRFARERQYKGIRVLLVSADSLKERAAVTKYLTSLGVDFPSYHKTGDDMEFINGIDVSWDGTIPASWLFDAKGKRVHLWNGALTYAQLTTKVNQFFPTAGAAPASVSSSTAAPSTAAPTKPKTKGNP